MSLRKMDVDASPDAAADAIMRIVREKGLKVYSATDHRRDIEDSGAAPFTAFTIAFGSPRLSSMLLAKNAELSVDLPIRISVVARTNGCRLIARDMHSLLSDFQIVNAENTANLINGIVDDVMTGARAICSTSKK